MRRATPILSSVLWLLAGCLGTSTGNPADGGGGDPVPDIATDDTFEGNPTLGHGAAEAGNQGCLDEPTVVDVDALTDLGFSAADVLAFAEGSHEETLTWNEPFNATIAPETGEQSITVTVTRGDGEVRWVDSVPDPDFHLEIATNCTGRLEIDVTVELQSSGGALDESLDVTLTARSELLASAFLRPDPDALGGALTITPTEPGFELAQIDLSMQFTPFGASGRLDVILEMRTDDAVTAGPGVAGGGSLASWGPSGAGNCEYGHVPIGLEDEVLARSGADVIAVLEAVDSAELRWNDGTTTSATLAFTARGEGICAQLESDPWSGDGAGALALTGTLGVESEDLRLSASWPIRVTALPEDAGGTISAGADWQYLSNDPTPAPYGVTDLDVEGYEELSLDLSLDYSPNDTGGARLTGMFTVLGFLPAECEPAIEYDEEGNIVGTGGCPGSEQEELIWAEIVSE